MDDFLARALVEAGASHCRVVVEANGGLLTALLAAGVLGSWSHCVGMCGPFVLTQVSARLEAVPASRLGERHRWSGALLVPYHLGRMTTYAGLGALAATVAAGVRSVPGFRWVGAALLLAAALGFLLAAVGRLRGAPLDWPRLPGSGAWSAAVGRLVRPLLADRGAAPGWRGYRLGLALGFIPCGLVYGALAAAAASGDPLAGALGMAAFGLGTVPALVAVGVAGHLAARAWMPVVGRVIPPLLVANAAGLAWLAWSMLVA